MRESKRTGAVPARTRNAKQRWLSSYPAGVDWMAPIEASSLVEMFDRAVAAYADRTCIYFLGSKLSYREVAKQTNRLAAGLQTKGLGHGNRIGLLLPNTPYYVIAYYAILKIGATVVNFNPLYTVEELHQQAKDAGLSAMVTLDLGQLAHKVEALHQRKVIEHVLLCSFPLILPPVKRTLFRLFNKKRLWQPKDKAGVWRWRDLTQNDGHFSPVAIEPNEDLALLQYTGGTTGIPKGAMLTHANLTANLEQVRMWFPPIDQEGARILAILPFFHVFAMTCVMNFGLRNGAELLMLPRFELGQAVKLLRRLKPAVMPGVPTLYSAILNYPGIRRDDLACLRFCISGGAPLPQELRQRFESFSGCRLVEGYGLSETSPVVTINPLAGTSKENSIGLPVPQTTISIRAIDDPKRELAAGQSGELCIKGPQVTRGYWNKPEENSSAFVDGFFRTGDVGYMDEDGFLYIVDRIKDLINCSGFKVYPRRIEEAIHRHAAVEEVTVIGIPDDYRGEVPKAFVKLRSGHSLTAEELRQFLAEHLSQIEMPAAIEFRDQLPKTLIGKPSKRELRAETRSQP